MFEKHSYDSPPMYSPPSHSYGPQGSFLPPQSEFEPYPPPPGSYYIGEEVPQHFYKWTSPPGIIKIMEGAVVVLCLGIFACVASTLVWDMQYGAGYGLGSYGSGYGLGSYGSNYYGSGHYGSSSYGSGYYGGYNYVSPYSAKSAMIAMAAINFIMALAVFVATFSKTRTIRSRKFYLVVLVCSVILAALQGIINIVYIVGVNPMAQSSANALYNPMLMMCQSLYGNSVTGMGGGFPLYNQYLYHYCYVDPQEAVAMVCGFLVVFALVVAAFFSYKTRSRIWRYGKHNVYWDEPLTGGTEGRDVEDWVNNMNGDGQSVHEASVMFSEKGAPPLNKSQSVSSIPFKGDPYTPPAYSERIVLSRGPDPESSSPSERTERKPAALRGKRRRRNPDLDDSQYETEYTTGGETGNELDPSHWTSLYPEITSSSQRQEYKKEFDLDLRAYKRLCAEIDDVNDELNKLSRELDTLSEGTNKYQAAAEEFNRLKDLKRMPDYQEKKQSCRHLRHKLFHIKRMVKEFDRAQS